MNRELVLKSIVEDGEAALLRLRPDNPIRPIIERNVREARAKLAGGF